VVKREQELHLSSSLAGSLVFVLTFLSFLTELEKPKYTCEICGKAYIRSWSFYGHMREHASGDKQHKCSICEKVFNYASNLRQHMLIHTGKEL
jgi:uncharacterized Zn-finger protein